MDKNEPQFYTPEQIAKMLQVTPESIRRYVRGGKLRAIKLGGKFIRIEKKEIKAFINRLETV